MTSYKLRVWCGMFIAPAFMTLIPAPTDAKQTASPVGTVNSRIHTHLMLPPVQVAVDENGDFVEISSPVPTGFILPNGMQQPFLHVMFENIDVKDIKEQ